jgi:probable HAF family extracellular repeat protein
MQLRLSKFDTGSAFRSALSASDYRGARIMPVYTYTTIDDPLVNSIQAFGINDEGQIVGQYTSGTNTHCFLYSGGVFTPIDDPLATDTFAGGINDNGQIVGYYRDGQGGRHGFLYSPNNPQHIFPPISPSMIPWPPLAPLQRASTMRGRSSDITPTLAAPTASS